MGTVITLLTSDGNRLDTRVEGRAEDKDSSHTAEAIGKGAGVVPVLEAEGGGALDATGNIAYRVSIVYSMMAAERTHMIENRK